MTTRRDVRLNSHAESFSEQVQAWAEFDLRSWLRMIGDSQIQYPDKPFETAAKSLPGGCLIKRLPKGPSGR